jgi:hypothetical protein
MLMGRSRDVLVLKDWEAGGGVVHWDGRSIALVRPSEVGRPD